MAADDSDAHRRGVRRLIIERLAAGTLPRSREQRIFGGRGDGAFCGCCDQPIGSADIQYDIDDEGAVQRTIPMHLHCYRLWVEESGSSK